MEDARAADIGIGRTERERAEADLRHATVRRVRGDGRRGRQVGTRATREEDRRGRGVARPRIRHRDTGDLAGGFIEDRDGRGTDTTATNELDQRSADIIGTRTRKGDAADARPGRAGEDGLDADGEAVGVHGHTAGVDGRSPDTAIDEVILRGDGAEDAVIGVNERDTIRRPDGELAELDGAAVTDVQDREFARIGVRGVQQRQRRQTTTDQTTATGDVELELAGLVAGGVLNRILDAICDIESAARDIDEALLIDTRTTDRREPSTDRQVAGAHFEDAVTAASGTDANFGQAQRVVRREPVVDQDITISTRRPPDGEGVGVGCAGQLQGALEVKGAGAAVGFAELDGVGTKDGVCGGDVDHTGTVHTDADEVTAGGDATAEVLEHRAAVQRDDRAAASAFGDVEVIALIDRDEAGTVVQRDRRRGRRQALAGVEARRETEGIDDRRTGGGQAVRRRRRGGAATQGEPSTNIERPAAEDDGAILAERVANDEFTGASDRIAGGSATVQGEGALLNRHGGAEPIAGARHVEAAAADTEAVRASTADGQVTAADLDELRVLAGVDDVSGEGEVVRARVEDVRTGRNFDRTTNRQVAARDGEVAGVAAVDRGEAKEATRRRPIDAARGRGEEVTPTEVDRSRIGLGRPGEAHGAGVAGDGDARRGAANRELLGLGQAVHRHRQGARATAEAITITARGECTRVVDVALRAQREVREVREVDGFGAIAHQGERTKRIAGDATTAEPTGDGRVIPSDAKRTTVHEENTGRGRERARAQDERTRVDRDGRRGVVIEGFGARERQRTATVLIEGEDWGLEEEVGGTSRGRRSGKGHRITCDRCDGRARWDADAVDLHAGDERGRVGDGHGRRRGQGAGHRLVHRDAERAGVGRGGVGQTDIHGVNREGGGRLIDEREVGVTGEATQGERGLGVDVERTSASGQGEGRILQGVGRPKDEATAADGRRAAEGIRLVERDIRCPRLHEVQDAQTVRQDAIKGRVGSGVDRQRRRRTDDVIDNRRAVHWLEDGDERLVVASQVEGRRSRGTEGQRGGRIETVIRAQDEATSEGVEGRVITAPRDADVTITDDRVGGRVRNEGRVVDWSREREDADAADRAGEDATTQVTRRVVGSDGDGAADGRRVVLAQHRDGAGAGAARATADREVIGQRDAVIQEQAGGRAGLRINRDRASAQRAGPRDDEVAPAEEGAARVGVRGEQVLRAWTELHERTRARDSTAERGGGQGEVRTNGQGIGAEVNRTHTRQEADVFATTEVEGRPIGDVEGEV